MPKKAGVAIVFSLLIDGLELIFPCIGNNHPNLTFICFRGVETTNQMMICVVATNSIVTCDMTWWHDIFGAPFPAKKWICCWNLRVHCRRYLWCSYSFCFRSIFWDTPMYLLPMYLQIFNICDIPRKLLAGISLFCRCENRPVGSTLWIRQACTTDTHWQPEPKGGPVGGRETGGISYDVQLNSNFQLFRVSIVSSQSSDRQGRYQRKVYFWVNYE